MKLKNPFKNLEPVENDSFVEIMQGAFWTMVTIALAEFAIKNIVYWYIATHMDEFINLVKQ